MKKSVEIIYFCVKIIRGVIRLNKKRVTNCEECENYYYDEESETYCCAMDLDEDEMLHFIIGDFGNCPYFRDNDEYRIVRKQN